MLDLKLLCLDFVEKSKERVPEIKELEQILVFEVLAEIHEAWETTMCNAVKPMI